MPVYLRKPQVHVQTMRAESEGGESKSRENESRESKS